MIDLDTSPSYDLAAVRSGIPLLERTIPMNNCSQAPQTDATRAAAEAYLESWNRDGMDWDRWMEEVESARSAFARLINADPGEVAVATSVSQALSSFASALDYGAGRHRVVLTDAEFPTVGHLWKAQEPRGAELAWAPVREGAVDEEALTALVDERTAAVQVAHGYYQTGALLDLERAGAVARDHGAIFLVDAYQTLGAVSVDVKADGIDVLASGNLKFLMGTPGIAFLYVRGEVAERLEPTVTGWFGRSEPFAFEARRLDWAVGARRFDTGTPPVLPAYVARAGMELLLDPGPTAVERWNRHLARRLVEGGLERGLELLGPRDPARRAPTTAFAVGPDVDSHAVERLMRERGVLPSARGPAIRLAPHFYTTEEEVEHALDVLVEVLRELKR